MRFDEAETAYKQAKSIRERLAQKNPDQFESELAQTLNDMGNLYTDTKRYQEAETAYGQAKAIEEKLTLSMLIYLTPNWPRRWKIWVFFTWKRSVIQKLKPLFNEPEPSRKSS